MLFVAWLGHAAEAGLTDGFDARVLLAMRDPGDLAVPRGPTWLLTAMRDITALGDSTLLTLVTSIAVGVALVSRRGATALFLALTVGFGAIADMLLKLSFSRPRPSLVPHLVDVTSASFPSGHAMNAAIVYLTLAALLGRHTADRRLRACLACIGIALALVIGASRIYLGVHYPTDVVGGLVAGSAWAAACWLLASKWRLAGDSGPRKGAGHGAGQGAERGRPLPLAAHPAKAREP